MLNISIWQLAFSGLIVLILYLKNFRTLDPIFGIYRQNAKWYSLKLCAMHSVLLLRKHPEPNHDELDKCQPLSTNPKAIDAVYFNGTSNDKSICGFGTAKRKNRLVNGFFVLRIPEYSDKILVHLKFPDTCLLQTAEEYDDLDAYAVEGIKLRPLVPMRSWKLNFNGKMKYKDSNNYVDVKLDAIWSTKLPPFSFETDIHPISLSREIALQPWSREYFDNLKRFHQTHYEQYGDIRGTATIEGTDYPVHVQAVRDHSFADVRDWKIFHRYVMHMFSLENGDRITCGVISIPMNFSSLEVGFITVAADGKNYPITSCNLKLYQHGEHGQPPEDYGFSFWAGGKNYAVQVKTFTKFDMYFGVDAEARIWEYYSEFSVNGIRGCGVAEWQYRHLDGLPSKI